MEKPTVTAVMATSWKRALNSARETAGLANRDKEPSDSWKSSILLAEHSPIRLVEYDIHIDSVRQWVTVHLVRHKFGVEHFVHSQREDRRHLDCSRDELPQGSLNDMQISANAQALISISRKRLCMCASQETREAWKLVKEAIRDIDPIMASRMVRECIYRGFCPEMKSCGYCNTKKYEEELSSYRNRIFS